MAAASVRFEQSSSSAAAMRPSKLILWAVCVALLAAELASAEASPPYEEVAADAGLQGMKALIHLHLSLAHFVLILHLILQLHFICARRFGQNVIKGSLSLALNVVVSHATWH